VGWPPYPAETCSSTQHTLLRPIMSARSPSRQINNYWIPNWSIHKRVLTQQLQHHLGPSATARSYTHHGEDGFLITTPGECLTDEQIDDICLKSQAVWDKQVAAKLGMASQKPLKRPLHQPILVSQMNSVGSQRKNKTRRGRKVRRTPSPGQQLRRSSTSQPTVMET